MAINWTNIIPAETNLFVIVTNEVSFGPYDFESIMHYNRGNFSLQPGVLDVLVPQPAYSEKYYYRNRCRWSSSNLDTFKLLTE